ncbi:MAG: hypothetical protein AAF629_27525 [Chloroflexota bacterium]
MNGPDGKKDARLQFRVTKEMKEQAQAKANRLRVPLALVVEEMLREWINGPDEFTIRAFDNEWVKEPS